MRAFLASVLSVIAVGVLLIAYGLLGTRVAAAPGMIQYDARGQAYELARPVYASERPVGVDLTDPYSPYAVRTSMGYPVNSVRPVAAPAGYDPYVAAAPVPRRVVTQSAPRTTTRVVERRSGRDWKKTALIIGGSTAGGAGLGAIFGGKKGALIGAAIGGGASTIYEATKR
ncbi:MAG: hypothetical protein AUH43_06570 [Acidobacteria bacterium 13_1_40CM_65_14]|nr:MAG: hypothetical protein AUH43_06570 [Acidobacteria bacterium 13_1_40CM_65_14]